jgi:hypothetical protein
MGSEDHRHSGIGVMCGHVWRGERPLLFVMRDRDGSWNFVCGDGVADTAAARSSDLKTVCFECARERDPSLAPLADLEPGFEATRDGPGERWTRTDRN